MATTHYGYLQLEYLDSKYPYLAGYADGANGVQVDRAVVDYNVVGTQVDRKIEALEELGTQVDRLIGDLHNIGTQVDRQIGSSSALGTQVDRAIEALEEVGIQVDRKIEGEDDDVSLGVQVDRAINELTELGVQVDREIVSPDDDVPVGVQVDRQILSDLSNHLQVKIGTLQHWMCDSYYLTRPYLETSYLTYCMRAFQGVQVDRKIVGESDDFKLGVQVDRQISGINVLGTQVDRKIETEDPLGIQVTRVKAAKTLTQVRRVIYNTTQLRILDVFLNRGTAALGGNTWTCNVATATGDFSPNNLNTDVIEERWQTVSGPTAFITLTCDTGATNTFVDTAAILDHNFTTSARVELQASTSPTFSSVDFSTVLTTESPDMYYIAPTLPTEGFRYWRFIIQDNSNPDGYLRAGVIVFGSARIMTVWETFQDTITFGKKHFKDTLETEGYTAVENDRATRKFLSLPFSNLRGVGADYAMLKEYWTENKTSLKALVIPDPTRVSEFAVFGKLVQLPSVERVVHADDLASFTLEWDESL